MINLRVTTIFIPKHGSKGLQNVGTSDRDYNRNCVDI